MSQTDELLQDSFLEKYPGFRIILFTILWIIVIPCFVILLAYLGARLA